MSTPIGKFYVKPTSRQEDWYPWVIKITKTSGKILRCEKGIVPPNQGTFIDHRELYSPASGGI